MTKTRIVIAALLVLAAASPSLAASAHRNQPVSSQGYAGGFVPGSEAEERWFAHASSHTGL